MATDERARVEMGYFGETFGLPYDKPLPWWEDDAEPNADMWATADESRDQIIGSLCVNLQRGSQLG